MRSFFLAVLMLGLATPAAAQTGVFDGVTRTPELILNGDVVIRSTMTGRYNEMGRQFTPWTFTGENARGVELRSFFVFELPSDIGEIFSAAIRLHAGGVEGSLNINFFSYEGQVASLLGGDTGHAIFEDLGGGRFFGNRFYSEQDAGLVGDVELNRYALHAIQNSNGYFAMGGSMGEPGVVTPEPLSMILMGTGLAGVGAAARRRRRDRIEGGESPA